jgi:hypothetical protein
LKRHYKFRQMEEFNEVFNLQGKPKRSKDSPSSPLGSRSGPFALRGYHKGKTIKALLKKDGSVRIDGETHTSLSSAATHVTGHPTNGRWFWHIKSGSGEWIRIKLV